MRTLLVVLEAELVEATAGTGKLERAACRAQSPDRRASVATLRGGRRRRVGTVAPHSRERPVRIAANGRFRSRL